MRAAAMMGHELIVIVPGARAGVTTVAPGVMIETLTSPRFPLDRRYRYFDDEPALHAALDRWRPDVVEASSPWASAAMVARWPGAARRALVMHADPLAAYAYRWFGRVASRPTIDRYFNRYWQHLQRLNESFDIVVSASRDLTRRLAMGGIDKVETIPMGVEPGVFSAHLRDESLRRALLARCGLGDDAILLAGIGRISSEKRWPMVIDAVAAAAAARPIGLVIAGDGRDRRRVERAIGGNPHVCLLGAIKGRAALARLLASADVFVHGCEAETFCMVAAEARASGLPLIVPDFGGASDHLAPGCGRHYTAADPYSLAAALRRLSPERVARYRQAAAGEAARTRSMNSHFVELFARYARSSADSVAA
jgi:alpha-1,6-mannosyltransferase